MEEQDQHLSREDFVEALEKLSCRDQKALLIMGKKFGNMYHLRDDPEALVQEAIERVLRGSRHIPSNLNVVHALGSIMGSIAEGSLASRIGKNETPFSKLGVDNIDEFPSPNAGSSPVEQLIGEQTVERIMNRFQDDVFVNALIQAVASGMPPEEIVTKIFKGDKKTYEATRKRFRRGMIQFKEEDMEA